MKILMLSTLVVALLLGACQTPPALTARDEPLRAVRRDSYFAVVRFLDEATLKARYGARYNPFIAFPRSITPSIFVAFKLNLEEIKRPLFLQLNQMVLAFGDKRVPPMDLEKMNKYWEFQDSDTGINQFDKGQRDRVLRDEMLSNEQSVPAGARLNKLVVFRANSSPVGETKLVIPLFDAQHQLVEQLEFTFTF